MAEETTYQHQQGLHVAGYQLTGAGEISAVSSLMSPTQQNMK